MTIAYVTITTLIWCAGATAASAKRERGFAAIYTMLAATGALVLFGLHA